MSVFQSGAVPWFSGLLKFSPEGAWNYCSGVAGFAFPVAGLRGSCPTCPCPRVGILPGSALSLAEFPGTCFTPATHTLADPETNRLSSGIWGKRQQKMAQRTKSKLAC